MQMTKKLSRNNRWISPDQVKVTQIVFLRKRCMAVMKIAILSFIWSGWHVTNDVDLLPVLRPVCVYVWDVPYPFMCVGPIGWCHIRCCYWCIALLDIIFFFVSSASDWPSSKLEWTRTSPIVPGRQQQPVKDERKVERKTQNKLNTTMQRKCLSSKEKAKIVKRYVFSCNQFYVCIVGWVSLFLSVHIIHCPSLFHCRPFRVALLYLPHKKGLE